LFFEVDWLTKLLLGLSAGAATGLAFTWRITFLRKASMARTQRTLKEKEYLAFKVQNVND